MKTQEHTAGATAGAKRAAHFIYYKWPTARPEAELAEYIDRETRVPLLLEALELADRWFSTPDPISDPQVGDVIRSIRAAIRSAKGETL